MSAKIEINCLGIKNVVYSVDVNGKISNSSPVAEVLHNFNFLKNTVTVSFSDIENEELLNRAISSLKEKCSKKITELSIKGKEFDIKQPDLLGLKVSKIVLFGPKIYRPPFDDEEAPTLYSKLKEKNWKIQRDNKINALWGQSPPQPKTKGEIRELDAKGKPRPLPIPPLGFSRPLGKHDRGCLGDI